MADISGMQELLLKYSYLIILGWTFLEGETIVIVAGFTAQKGWLNPWLIAMCAFLGSFSSDQLMFALGKYKGQHILTRFPRLEKNSAKARQLMIKYETPLILGFRFVYGVRNVTPILLGISGVNHLKFFVLNMLGAVVWALSFTFGGYYFGHIFAKYTEDLAYAEVWLIGIILSIVMLVMLVRRLRNKGQPPSPPIPNHDNYETVSGAPTLSPSGVEDDENR
ncbi:MAG: DedA family protein [Desulfovibrionaceae bacterium]|nr:DedA family protein [Desulfovibrionaceae bacterium]